LKGNGSITLSNVSSQLGPVALQQLKTLKVSIEQSQLHVGTIATTLGTREIKAQLSPDAKLTIGSDQKLDISVDGTSVALNAPVKLQALLPRVDVIAKKSGGKDEVRLNQVDADLSIEPGESTALKGTLKLKVDADVIRDRLVAAATENNLATHGPISDVTYEATGETVDVDAVLDFNATDKQTMKVSLAIPKGLALRAKGKSLENSRLDAGFSLAAVNAEFSLANKTSDQTIDFSLNNASEVVVHKTNVGPANNGLFVWLKTFTVNGRLTYQLKLTNDGDVYLTPKAFAPADAGPVDLVKIDIRQFLDANVTLDHIDREKMHYRGSLGFIIRVSGDAPNPIFAGFNKIKNKPIKLNK